MIFDEFIGKEVKATFTDGAAVKPARGILVETDGYFVKIAASPEKTIIINVGNIQKMSPVVRE